MAVRYTGIENRRMSRGKSDSMSQEKVLKNQHENHLGNIRCNLCKQKNVKTCYRGMQNENRVGTYWKSDLKQVRKIRNSVRRGK